MSLVSGSAAALDTDMRTFCNENTVTKFRMGRRGIRQGVCTTSNSLSSMGKTGLIGREQLLVIINFVTLTNVRKNITVDVDLYATLNSAIN